MLNVQFSILNVQVKKKAVPPSVARGLSLHEGDKRRALSNSWLSAT